MNLPCFTNLRCVSLQCKLPSGYETKRSSGALVHLFMGCFWLGDLWDPETAIGLS